MQPSHLCCPSSTTSDYASSQISTFILSILHSAGFSKSSSQAVELLTEVFERYLLLLGSTSKHHANHVGRRIGGPWDVELALNDLGSSTEDIRHWFDEEGGDVAGRWMSEEEMTEAQEVSSTAKRLGDLSRVGRVFHDEEDGMFLHYEELGEAQRAEWSELSVADEETGEDFDEITHAHSNGILAGSSPPPPYRSRESEESSTSEPPRYKKRRISSTSIEYIPAFLPSFPEDEDNETSITITTENDAEYERARQEGLRKGVDKRRLLNGASHADTGLEVQEAKVLASREMAPEAKKSAEDCWHSAVDFASSTLAQQQSIEDLPADRFDESEIDLRTSTSAQRTFANDYIALITEANTVPPSLLTPLGVGFVNAFNQRRALADLVSNPSKYVPTDTIFGAIDARPTATPFIPGPSLLITPPTASNPAPTFTPVQPSGRELVSTSTINNSLFPACKHRKPSNILAASRLLSGGEASETFRRITRTLDPIPILDERHAERVFHGMQAAKELLHDDNSFLREALDILKFRRDEEAKAGELDEDGEMQQSQFGLNANRDKLKIKSGTLVQTWDWMARDYTDPILPGRKYRRGTIGVKISSAAAVELDSVDVSGAGQDQSTELDQESTIA